MELHIKANPGTKRRDLLGRLNYALAAKERGVTCACGQPLWVIGSAEAGLGCFRCITGEPVPDNDYEIELAKDAAQQVHAPDRQKAALLGSHAASRRGGG